MNSCEGLEIYVGRNKMTLKLEELLERLRPVARDEIVRVLRHPDVCIPTCRILQAVLRHFGFKSYPVATEVTACNSMYAETLRTLGGRDNATEPTREQKRDWQEKGAFAVAISPKTAVAGVPVATEGWDGHLVLRVGDILLDGSIDMCSRPAQGIVLPKMLWVQVDSDWDAPGGIVGVTLLNGCEVTYEHLNDDSWRDSPYWNDETDMILSTANAIVNRVSQ
jgi:hypothetical protein